MVSGAAVVVAFVDIDDVELVTAVEAAVVVFEVEEVVVMGVEVIDVLLFGLTIVAVICVGIVGGGLGPILVPLVVFLILATTMPRISCWESD